MDQWFDRNKLRWLKDSVQATRKHLDRCVRGTDMQQLPEQVERHTLAMVFQEAPQRATTPPGAGRLLPSKEEGPPPFELVDEEPDPEELKYVPSHLHHK